MNAYADVRKIDVSAVFDLTDPSAKPDCTTSSTNNAPISQVSQVINGIDEISCKIGTLEKNYFALDGSFTAIDSVSGLETGWWSSAISDDDCVIDQSITFTFGGVHSTYGLEMHFDDKTNNYPTEVNIKVYDVNNSLISDSTLTIDGYVKKLYTPLDNYKKIVLRFTKTSKPHRRIRLLEVYFGVVEKFNPSNVSALTIEKELDPSSESLPISEVNMTFDNSEKRYNMLSPDGAFKFLNSTMPLQVQIGCDGEMENMGTFYYYSSESDDDSLTAKITAQDPIMYLDNFPYTPTSGTTVTINQLTNQINTLTGLNLIFAIDSTLTATLTNLPADANVSCREALRCCCQALKSVCFVGKDGKVYIKPLAIGTVKDTLDSDKMMSSPKITTTERITKYKVENGDIVGAYEDKEDGEITQEKSASNSFITSTNVNDVAEWLLGNTRLYHYDIDARGVPTRELGETIKVKDAFNVNRDTIITKHILNYDGGLTEQIECISKKEAT